MTVSGVPNIRVVLREADDDNLLVDVPNLTVKVTQDSSYNVTTTQPVSVVIFSGSYNRFADVALLAYTASYISGSSIVAGFATSASYAETFNRQVSGSLTITGSTTITDNLTVEGIISAEKLLVSSSIIYESGSTKFGDSPEDTHQFTGSVLVQGPISASGITGSFKGDGSQLTGLVTDLRISGSTGSDTLNLLTDNLLITGSKGIAVAVTNNTVTIDVPTGLTASLYGTASVAEGIHIVSAGIYVTGSDSFIVPTPSGGFSIITSASYALTASYIANNTWESLLNIPSGLVSSSVQVYYFPVQTATSASYALTASYAANGGGGGASDWNSITGKPAGLVSSSTQINTGSFSGSFTGSLLGTSSWASNVVSSSFAATASYALNSSTVSAGTVSSSTQITNYNIFATTGSNTFNGNQTITGSLLTNADTLTFTGSIYSTGSNIHTGTQVISGSLTVTGSIRATEMILPLTSSTSPQTGSMFYSSSFIYVYDGTRYRSASLV